MDRDRFMSAEEARDYGLLDHVITKRSDIQPAKQAALDGGRGEGQNSLRSPS